MLLGIRRDLRSSAVFGEGSKTTWKEGPASTCSETVFLHCSSVSPAAANLSLNVHGKVRPIPTQLEGLTIHGGLSAGTRFRLSSAHMHVCIGAEGLYVSDGNMCPLHVKTDCYCFWCRGPLWSPKCVFFWRVFHHWEPQWKSSIHKQDVFK